MDTYETFAKVEEQGRVLVAGVPFPPGTEVEVIIKAAGSAAQADSLTVGDRATRLFSALDQARNTEPIGRLNREELYERQVLR